MKPIFDENIKTYLTNNDIEDIMIVFEKLKAGDKKDYNEKNVIIASLGAYHNNLVNIIGCYYQMIKISKSKNEPYINELNKLREYSRESSNERKIIKKLLRAVKQYMIDKYSSALPEIKYFKYDTAARIYLACLEEPGKSIKDIVNNYDKPGAYVIEKDVSKARNILKRK